LRGDVLWYVAPGTPQFDTEIAASGSEILRLGEKRAIYGWKIRQLLGDQALPGHLVDLNVLFFALDLDRRQFFQR
jgi:hypothetical protein